MRVSRLFYEGSLSVGNSIELNASSTHYLAHVLRVNVRDSLVLFNGCGGEYHAEVVNITRKCITVAILQHVNVERESPLSIHLAQAIAHNDNMHYILQKAVELGVTAITPLVTQYSFVKNIAKIPAKRQQHWQAIIISACEQCGRNRIPQLHAPLPLQAWLQQNSACKLILQPNAQTRVNDLNIHTSQPISVLIGAEGGFSEREVQQAMLMGYTAIQLGPRVLRTETATVATLTVLQHSYGDLSH